MWAFHSGPFHGLIFSTITQQLKTCVKLLKATLNNVFFPPPDVHPVKDAAVSRDSHVSSLYKVRCVENCVVIW